MIRMVEEDLNALRAAVATLEHPALAARLGNIAGKPIELVGRALPAAASEAVATATTKALHAALAVALRTMEKEPINFERGSAEYGSSNLACVIGAVWASRRPARATRKASDQEQKTRKFRTWKCRVRLLQPGLRYGYIGA